MQAKSIASTSSSSKAPNAVRQTTDCIRAIYHVNGFKGFYRGFGVTALREAPSIGLYFFSYKYAREALTQIQGLSSPNPAAIMCAGGIAGALSWTVIYPFDVIKTNVQINTGGSSSSSNTGTNATTPTLTGPAAQSNAAGSQLCSRAAPGQPTNNFSNMSTVAVAKSLYRQYGWKVFTRGLGTTVLRAFPVNASTFYCYEFIKKDLHLE
jgi:solute carrier family 25 carnitine/acylcarnitine transporter 20/29